MYIVFWYSLYVAACAQTNPPLWALQGIEQLKPTFGALVTAARLSDHPFPTQVMILYAFFSSPLLGIFWVYYSFLVQHLAQDTYRGLCERWGTRGLPVTTRLKLAACGVAILSVCLYVFPVYSLMGGGYWDNGHLNGWLYPAIFSTSILSATFFLFFSAGVAMSWVLGFLFIYMSLLRLQSPTSGRG